MIPASRIAIVMTEGLPVPAVLGGAVEGLVDKLLGQRESREDGPSFHVISTYDEKAADKAKIYRNTRFTFLKPWAFQTLIQKVFNKISLVLWKRLPGPIFLFKAASKLKKMDLDLVIVENRPEFITYLRNRLPTVKLVLHLHNDTLNKDELESTEVVQDLNSVFCVSRYIQSRVGTIEAASPEKVHVLYNGVDLDLFRFKALSPDLPPEPMIAYLGRVSESKGVGILMEAYLEVRKKIPTLRLKIFGSSWYGNKIREPFLDHLEEASKGLTDFISFAGYVSQEQLPKALEGVSVLVVPSLWEEPAGLTVVEGQALGIPVIAADRGGIPELITPETGTLFDSRNHGKEHLIEALFAVLDDYPAAIQKASVARKRVEINFGLQTYYETFLLLSEKLLEE